RRDRNSGARKATLHLGDLIFTNLATYNPKQLPTKLSRYSKNLIMTFIDQGKDQSFNFHCRRILKYDLLAWINSRV
uniref:hypothetical protein n=1 Tax=Pseudomonas mohnii TaxID=395600 RepID=UPI001A7E5C58